MWREIHTGYLLPQYALSSTIQMQYSHVLLPSFTSHVLHLITLKLKTMREKRTRSKKRVYIREHVELKKKTYSCLKLRDIFNKDRFVSA